MFIKHLFIFISVLFLFQSCANLRQNVLFQTDDSFNQESFKSAFLKASKNYTIDKFDNLAISVYTNNGEILVDPNSEFQIGKSQNTSNQNNNGQQNLIQAENTNSIFNLPIKSNSSTPNSYKINENGIANLPLVGKVKLEGFTLMQADSLLSNKYQKFYEDAYVLTQYLNKRVILLGALGDKVIPLYNENMNLIEVLALAGNVQQSAQPNKIRIIRGDLKNPSIQLVDISTFKGIQETSLLIQPNDIIYVEPKRKVDTESLKNTTTIVSLITGIISSTLTIFFIIDRL